MDDSLFPMKVLRQVEKMSIPCLRVSPALHMPIEHWHLLASVIQKAANNVADKIVNIICVTVDDIIGHPSEHRICEDSPDGMHELVEFENKMVKKCMICIHCGEMYRITKKTKEELEECFVKKEQ